MRNGFNKKKSAFGSKQEKQEAAQNIGNAMSGDKKTNKLLRQGKVNKAQRRMDNANQSKQFLDNKPENTGSGVQKLYDKGKFGKANNLAKTVKSINPNFNQGQNNGNAGNAMGNATMSGGMPPAPGADPIDNSNGQPNPNASKVMYPSDNQQQAQGPNTFKEAVGNAEWSNGYPGNQHPAQNTLPERREDISVNENNTFQDTNINSQGAQGKDLTEIGVGQQAEGMNQAADGASEIEKAIAELKSMSSGFAGALGSFSDSESYGKTDDASNKAFDYLSNAMSANVDDDFLANNQNFYNENEDMIRQQYSADGIYGKDYEDAANFASADMASRGLFSSDMDDSAQAALLGDLKDRETAALLANRQAGRGEYIDERGRVTNAGIAAGGTAGNIGDTFAGLAGEEGDQDNTLRGLIMQAGNSQGDMATALGNLGINMADLGIKTTGQGLEAQNQAINNYLGSLGLEAQIQMAKEILENQFRQQGMVNVQTKNQNKKNQNIINQTSGEILA